MKIKNKALIAVMVAGLAFTGLQQASARGWGGGYGGGGYGFNGPCAGYGLNYQQLDEATRDKLDVFRAETVELRKQIAMKRAEKRALMSSETPDPAAVARVEGELFDLRTTMQQKASDAGIPMMGGPRGMRSMGGGRGPGGGRMMPYGDPQFWN